MQNVLVRLYVRQSLDFKSDFKSVTRSRALTDRIIWRVHAETNILAIDWVCVRTLETVKMTFNVIKMHSHLLTDYNNGVGSVSARMRAGGSRRFARLHPEPCRLHERRCKGIRHPEFGSNIKRLGKETGNGVVAAPTYMQHAVLSFLFCSVL